MTANDKRQAFRRILAGTACLHPASVGDPLSMRAAQEIGFETAMLGGSVASLVVLGAPDVTVLTLTELADLTRRLCRAGDVPLMVDGDHGYGNALNVRRTVEELELAGAAAVTIEDTNLPAAFGDTRAALLSVREAAAKVRAGIDARVEGAFCVVGRTSAAKCRDPQELLDRLAALQDAGADAIFLTGVKSLSDLDVIAATARVPLMLGAVPSGVSAHELASRKVRLCLQGHSATAEAAAAIYRRLHLLRTGKEPAALEPQALLKRLSRSELYASWAREWLE